MMKTNTSVITSAGLFIFIYLYIVTGLPDSDRVDYLPGLWPPADFIHFSGYLDGHDANIKLHYWLLEAQYNPIEAPLLLWLNGGPGCSSMEGLLRENGPFRVVKGPKLVLNPYSWNTFANVLYLEAPAGVGFSFAVDGNVTTDDDFTSLNNYHALVNFVKIFPEYRGRDFYITGESYGGVYIPTLTLRVLEKPFGLKLKGIAVGNGLTSYDLNDNSLLYFLYHHGLIDEPLWNTLLTECCSASSTVKCMFSDNRSSECQQLVKYLTVDLSRGLNVYNLYGPCAGGVPSEDSLSGGVRLAQLVHFDFGNQLRGNRFMQMERRVMSMSKRQASQTKIKLPCVDDSAIQGYLNMEVVQRALHVHKPLGRDQIEWEICDEKVNSMYGRTYSDLRPQYSCILQQQVPILIYNGDVDMACNFLGDEWFVDSLNLTVSKPLKRWLYPNDDSTTQVGGFRKVLRHPDTGTLLTYTTVRGSGHMVPEDKPIPSLHMILQFVRTGTMD